MLLEVQDNLSQFHCLLDELLVTPKQVLIGGISEIHDYWGIGAEERRVC